VQSLNLFLCGTDDFIDRATSVFELVAGEDSRRFAAARVDAVIAQAAPPGRRYVLGSGACILVRDDRVDMVGMRCIGRSSNSCQRHGHPQRSGP
jgi:hypothetical protein